MALTALTDGGRSAVLLPRPCFPLYATLADFVGAETVYYDLLPERGWEADLPKLRETIASLGDRAACLMVNNPGNPTGSVYAARLTCASSARSARTPACPSWPTRCTRAWRLTAGTRTRPSRPCAAAARSSPWGALKLWLAPGWRLGWLNVHDSPERVLREHEVVLALQRMAQITIGTACPVQAALPRIIAETPEEFFADTCETLRARAALCAARVEAMPSRALRVTTQPQGAMYLFVRVDADFLAKAGIADDTAFCQGCSPRRASCCCRARPSRRRASHASSCARRTRSSTRPSTASTRSAPSWRAERLRPRAPARTRKHNTQPPQRQRRWPPCDQF